MNGLDAAIAEALGPPLGVGVSIALSALAPFLLLPLAILMLGRSARAVALPATALIELVSAAAERIAQVLLVVLLLATLLIVVLRYVFGFGSNALFETALFAHGLAFLLAAPAALGRDAHVRVDVVFQGFSQRGKALVDVAAFHLFLAPMCLAVLSVSEAFVGLSWRMAERSAESDGLAYWYLVKTAIPVFAVLLLAQGVAWACRAACVLRRLEPAPPRFEADRERPA